MSKKNKPQVQAIIQALNAAETNIKLAKQLLTSTDFATSKKEKSPREMPGIMGTFDGVNMVADKDGKKYPVNPNYASKSRLVYGDTLKMIDQDGKNFFKQVDTVEREEVDGILAKKEGEFFAVTPEAAYKLLAEAVEFHEGSEGDKVVVIVPKSKKDVPFAALEDVIKESGKDSQETGEKEVKGSKDEKEAQEEKKPYKKSGEAVSKASKKPSKRSKKKQKKTEEVAKEENQDKMDQASVEDDEELR